MEVWFIVALFSSVVATYMWGRGNGYKQGREIGWYTGWNDCNRSHIELGTLTPNQVQTFEQRISGES